MAQFPAVIDLATLTGSTGLNPGVRLNGIDADDRSGWSVASAGDVNGDGFADLIIGAYYGDPGGDNAAAKAMWCSARPVGFAASLDLSTLNGTNGFRLDGIDAGDISGFSVASAGDVNGDGFDDLIIGAPRADPAATISCRRDLCGVRQGLGLCRRASTSRTLDGTNGFRLDGIDAVDKAAARSPRPATSMATASPI